MKTLMAMALFFTSLQATAANKKMICAVSENNVLVKSVEVELTEKMDRFEFGIINELTVILNDIPNSNQFLIKMIGAELGIINEVVGSFGPNGEGFSSTILIRGYTTSISCAPIK